MRNIPFKKLNKVTLEQHCDVMRKGNNLLRKCAESVNMEYRKFRTKIFKKQFDFAEPARTEILKAMPAIQAVRDIEWDMICCFSGLVNKIAGKWNHFDIREDLEQEGLMALIDAIYSYTREEVKFVTFAQWAIDRRLWTALNRTNTSFCPLTNQARQLMQLFSEAEKKFNGPHNQEQIIESLDVTLDEKQIIRDCLVTATPCSQHETDDEQHDYTAVRRGIDNETGDPIPADYQFCTFEGEIPLDMDLRRAIANADLNELELEVLETSLCERHGWQEAIAAKTINPRTGNRYTRQAISVILQSALKKVKAAYLTKQVA